MKQFKASRSKVIDYVWYNPETKILSVKFVDKNKSIGNKDRRPKEYLYVEVTNSVFNKFKKAKSKGRFFTTHIRDNYLSQHNVF
jgi:hypothetical protein